MELNTEEVGRILVAKQEDLEIELFRSGIKPSLFINKERVLKSNLENNSEYYTLETEKYVMFSHKPLPERKHITTELMGKLLGYYPKSCEEIKNDNRENIFLNFNGIFFNTKGYTAEAFNWCKKQYMASILELKGRVKYSIRCTSSDLMCIKEIKVGVITKRGVK